MLKISKIEEQEYILEYLEKRNLTKQYIKAKSNIISGAYTGNKLKLREPKKDSKYYFRINKQFRAIGYIENETLVVFQIDNHQHS